jgi:predicted small integral membrane protein
MLDLTWMAWTWPSGAFFVTLVFSIVVMGLWERKSPGGNPRRGVFGIDTTRGDRLFISWLGTGFIHLGWLAAFSTPLWGALVLAIGWFVFVFKKA